MDPDDTGRLLKTSDDSDYERLRATQDNSDRRWMTSDDSYRSRTLHQMAPVDIDRFQFRSTLNDSYSKRLRTTPNDFGRLRTTPNVSGRLQTTSDDFESLRTTPDDSDYERFQMAPDASERLRTTPTSIGNSGSNFVGIVLTTAGVWSESADSR